MSYRKTVTKLGSLTGFLQKRFADFCPEGWSCSHEVDVLDAHWQKTLGYSARADVLLTRDDGARRIWVEFEVSRADPVANHAKFATSHLFQPQLPTDTFIAMVSPHVSRGRRNLAANTILLMRRVGMSAFQTVLFPTLPAVEIKRLNHLSPHKLESHSIDAKAELHRVLTITTPLSKSDGYQLHYAGDLLDVFSNVQRFNDELNTADGQSRWGKRTIKYFAYDSKTGQFAPTKFCAYINAIPTSVLTTAKGQSHPQLMSMPLYTSLDEGESKFDGNLAQTHLQRQLNMQCITPDQSPDVAKSFSAWQQKQSDHIGVHNQGPIFLLAPRWFV